MSSGVEGKRERGVQAGGTPRCQNNARSAAKAYLPVSRPAAADVEGEKKRESRRKIGGEEIAARATKKKEHVVYVV